MSGDLDPERHPSAQRRAQRRRDLLADLERVNQALARNNALPNLTVDEATSRTLTVDRLRAIVDASWARLADLIAATR